MKLRTSQSLHERHGASERGAPRLTGWPVAILAWLAARLSSRARVRNDLVELGRLDDNMLRDIGISRWDVERMRAGWYRRGSDT